MDRGRRHFRTGLLALTALGAAALLAAAPAAWAGHPVELKTEVSSGSTVTLGDLFDAAGSEAAVVVGNGAPAGESAVLDAAVVRNLARQHGLDWDNPGNITRIVVPRGGPATPAAHMAETLTYARSLSTGDIVQPEDLTYAKVAVFAVPPDAPSDPAQIIGKVARRPLRSGAAAATHDVTLPMVIKTGDAVQVAYNADGVSLVLQGKANSTAALGEPVEIVNPISKKVIQAIASGPDEAVVGPDAEQFRARPGALPAQFAALR
jgi:flagella basal body P-ring formation protein FlgA